MREEPTVGRAVHYYTDNPVEQFNGQMAGPYAATVSQCFVGSIYVNLKVLPPFGLPYDAGSVPHKDDLPVGSASRYWEWPPRAGARA